MLLYEHPLSSYVQKVKIALREKNISFTVERPVGLGSGAAAGAFLEGNLRSQVPMLIDGSVRIVDSTIILEYLEDKVPAPALLPRDPAGRARARMIEDVCDTSYEAINWGIGEITWFHRAEGALADRLRAAAAAQPLKSSSGWNSSWENGSGLLAIGSVGLICQLRHISTDRYFLDWGRRPARRSIYGSDASANFRRLPKHSRNSWRRRS